MDFKFIHAADIHLDSPLRGLERYEGAPVEKIRGSTREAFVRLVDLAIEEKVAFMVIAGDLYDGDWKDYYTGLFFANQMTRLRQENIPVYVIKGNHDAASVISKQIKLPDNVTVFPSDQPSTSILENLRVALHGQSFESRAVKDNLALSYPEPKENYLNIGLLHTSVSGREGHEPYAPCSLEDLQGKGYDYWALGHIHKRELLSERDPVVLFPGNIQGRHIRETGPKGCTLVEVSDHEIKHLEHYTLDVLRWEKCVVDVSGAQSIDEILHFVQPRLEEQVDQAEGKPLAIRIDLHGSSPIHAELQSEKDHLIANIRSLAIDIGFGDIWVEKVKIHTTPTNLLEDQLDDQTPIASILSYIESLSEDEETLKEILAEFHSLKRNLPRELQQGEDTFSVDNTDLIKERLDQVKGRILYYLTEREVKSS